VLCVALSRLDVCLLCASLSVTVLDVRKSIPYTRVEYMWVWCRL
jgi:hypothetical protein